MEQTTVEVNLKATQVITAEDAAKIIAAAETLQLKWVEWGDTVRGGKPARIWALLTPGAKLGNAHFYEILVEHMS